MVTSFIVKKQTLDIKRSKPHSNYLEKMAKRSRIITMSPLVLEQEDDLDLWEFVNPSDGEYSDDSFSVDSLSDDDVISLDDASFVSPSVISLPPQILLKTDGEDLAADLDLDDGHVGGDGADFGDGVCGDGADFGDDVCRERVVDDNDLGWAHQRMVRLGRGSRYVVGITYGGYVNRDGCDDDEDEDRSGEDGDYDYSYDLDDELVPRSVSKMLGRQRMKKLGKRAIAKVAKISKTSRVFKQRESSRKMTVKIRLARFGCKHRPFYRLVAADDKSRREGKQIEVLGFYDPLQGKDDMRRVSLKFDRIKYWLSVGAQPTDTVEDMLFRIGLIPPKSMVVAGSRNGSTSQHVSPITGEILN